jgi:imidazolonepropionase-like amidohydrolase
MRRMLAILGAAALLSVPPAGAAGAQTIIITNARVLDGAGKVIERGTILAQDGRIVSVTAGAAPKGAPRGATRIDAHGRTVLPAFIDVHRHLIQGEGQAWLAQKAPAEMKGFLEGGFTTVYSMGDDPQAILAVRARLASGELPGPRLMAVRMLPLGKGFPEPAIPPAPSQYRDPGRTDPARPPARPVKPAPAIADADARAMVDQAKAQGFDAIKTILVATPGGTEAHTLGVIVDEAHKQGLRVFTHATHYLDSLTAVSAKVDVLAHTPHIGQLEENAPALQAIADSHIPVVSTLGVFIPHFGETGEPLYRDGGPFPMPRPLSSAGQGPVNARLLWDKGVTYAFGTDTQWDPRESLRDELRGLSLVFSPRDILKIMGPNSAAVAGRSADLGTLEPGKLADMVMVEGDPLDDIYSLTRVLVVVKEGKVVVDKTTRRRASKAP